MSLKFIHTEWLAPVLLLTRTCLTECASDQKSCPVTVSYYDPRRALTLTATPAPAHVGHCQNPRRRRASEGHLQLILSGRARAVLLDVHEEEEEEEGAARCSRRVSHDSVYHCRPFKVGSIGRMISTAALDCNSLVESISSPNTFTSPLTFTYAASRSNGLYLRV